jgi:DNA-directed RNA polymerase specialized sigma24 family protein
LETFDQINAGILEKRVHDELTLFRIIVLGDECAFERIFELYKSRLVSYLIVFTKSTEEAKELTQEIFLKVWMACEKLSAIESTESYLFVWTNKALDYLRKASVDSRANQLPASADLSGMKCRRK